MIEDAEMERIVIADLRYLDQTWNLDVIDDDFLRRDTALLRRLLIDGGGGLLRRYLKSRGLRGDLKSPRLSGHRDSLA